MSVPSAAQGCPLTSLEALFRREWVSRVLPMASNGAGAAGIVALPAPWTGAEEEIPAGSTGGGGAELPEAHSDIMERGKCKCKWTSIRLLKHYLGHNNRKSERPSH
jgi:hypothetical protein